MPAECKHHHAAQVTQALVNYYHKRGATDVQGKLHSATTIKAKDENIVDIGPELRDIVQTRLEIRLITGREIAGGNSRCIFNTMVVVTTTPDGTTKRRAGILHSVDPRLLKPMLIVPESTLPAILPLLYSDAFHLNN